MKPRYPSLLAAAALGLAASSCGRGEPFDETLPFPLTSTDHRSDAGAPRDAGSPRDAGTQAPAADAGPASNESPVAGGMPWVDFDGGTP